MGCCYSCFGSRNEEREEQVAPIDIWGGAKPKIFTYRDIEITTKKFRDLVGEGRLARVYKGKLERTGQIVAVKDLSQSGAEYMRKFWKEIEKLTYSRHPNVVKLIGYSVDVGHRFLVYEFMPLGSLESHLYGPKGSLNPLDWNTRMKIAAGAAKGLYYLHNETKPQIIFRDLKSSNILLDEGFHPKLCDFGISKPDFRCDVSREWSTMGYTAPEFAPTGIHTVKTDVYNFGIVMLELISGQRPADMTLKNGKHKLVKVARTWMREPSALFGLVDARMQRDFTVDSLCKAVEVALMCLEDDPECRPHMNFVVEAMNYITSPDDAAAADAVVERPMSSSVENVAEKDEIVEEKEENEETRLLSGSTVESHVVDKDEIEEEEEEDEKARLVSRRRSEKRHEE